MTEQLVPTQRCAVDVLSLYLALRLAWRDQVGTEPRREQLLVLMAQSDLETGTWSQCMNFNLGGLKHVTGDGHNFARYLTTEYIHGVKQELEQDFRAYASLDESVPDYLHELRARFGGAWPAVEAGDVADFAHRLKLRGYFTAPEEQYAAGLAARYQSLDARIPPDTSPEPLLTDKSEFLDEAAEQVGREPSSGDA